MTKHVKSFYGNISNALIENLKNKNIDATLCNNKDEARKIVLAMTEKESTVGYGGSSTLVECGIIDSLRNNENITLLDRDKPGLSTDEKLKLWDKALTCDFFLSGINAISLDGSLHFSDANGNRVASVLFGPKKVVLVAGVNKICPDKDYAYKRVKFLGAGINGSRLNWEYPFKDDRNNTNLLDDSKFCAYHVRIDHNIKKDRIHVILVNEYLGF